MSSLAASLAIIQKNAIRYGFPLLLTLGNVGNLLFIFIVSRKRHRQNSCSLYLLASAVFGLIGINWGLGTNLNALYQSPDPFNISFTLCRMRGYILQTTAVIYRTMIVLACIDRFALSSPRVNIRAFSKPKIALKLIGGTIAFWMIAAIHQPIFQTIQNNRCGIFGSYGLFFSIYQICLFEIILPGLMILFGILFWKNLKAIRVRVQPLQVTNNLRRHILHMRDINLMKFVLAEVIVGIILTFLYPIYTLYFVLTSNIPNKSHERIQIEAFMSFVSMSLLFYLNYCITFYLYIIMSKSFRQEVKRVVLKCLKKAIPEQARPDLHMVPLRELPNACDRKYQPAIVT